MPVGAYPGTFDPPTVAHAAVAEAAWRQGGLDRVELVVSEHPLGKNVGVSPLPTRMKLIEALASTRPWLGVRVTGSRLISDIAEGFDAVVLGADKWAQIADEAWYEGSSVERDAAVARLPRILLAPRGALVPAGLPAGALILDLDASHSEVSSTAVRAGRLEWLAPECSQRDGTPY